MNWRVGSPNKQKYPVGLDIKRLTGFFSGAEGGSRTHMWGEPRRILSPLRLPVPPLRQFYMLSTKLIILETCSLFKHREH